MTKESLNKNLCPFNGMQQCIGKDCVMYLETTSIKRSDTGEEIKGNAFIVLSDTPCALLFSGLKSAYDMIEHKLKFG